MSLRTSAHPVATPHAAVITTALQCLSTSISPRAAGLTLPIKARIAAAKIHFTDGTNQHGVGKKLDGEGGKVISNGNRDSGKLISHATAKKDLRTGTNSRFLRVTHHDEPRRAAGGLSRGRHVRVD